MPEQELVKEGNEIKVIRNEASKEQSYSMDYVTERRAELATQQSKIDDELAFLNTIEAAFNEE